MVYGAELRQRFFATARAGALTGSQGRLCEGTAEDQSLAIWVRFQLEVRAGTIGRVRFRAFGCPHTLAAADRVAAALEGRSVAALTEFDWPALAGALELPREKFGKLLRIEDALAACHAQAQRLQES
jgi:NifU-like protein involved in Fe-S cluster formation